MASRPLHRWPKVVRKRYHAKPPSCRFTVLNACGGRAVQEGCSARCSLGPWSHDRRLIPAV